jgi:hypothetical protein
MDSVMGWAAIMPDFSRRERLGRHEGQNFPGNLRFHARRLCTGPGFSGIFPCSDVWRQACELQFKRNYMYFIY